MSNKIILFDAGSTSDLSQILSLLPGECMRVTAANLVDPQQATLLAVLVRDGIIPSTQSNACCPTPPVQPSEILAETPFNPCGDINGPANVNSLDNELVVKGPGYYRFQISPAAIGTAVVEAEIFPCVDACAEQTVQCCEVTLCQMIANLPAGIPVATDEFPVRHLDGTCEAVTLTDALQLYPLCTNLGLLPQLGLSPTDLVVSISATGQCKTLPVSAFTGGGAIELCDAMHALPLLTPTATSQAPFYDGALCGTATPDQFLAATNLCAKINASFPNAPAPSATTLFMVSDSITQACGFNDLASLTAAIEAGLVLTPAQVCAAIMLFTPGIITGADSIPAFDGGGCKLITVNNIVALANAFPKLAPDGQCAAPSYSFISDGSSGMFFDPTTPQTGTPAVTIGFSNCTSRLDVGAAIYASAAGAVLALGFSGAALMKSSDGVLSAGADASVIAGTGSPGFGGGTARLMAGAAFGVGTAGGVGYVTGGSAGLTETAGNAQITGGTASGGADGGHVILTGSNTVAGGQAGSVRIYGGAGAAPALSGDILLSVDNPLQLNPADLVITRLHEWRLGVNPGTAGQVITSQGVGAAPIWASQSVTYPLTATNGACATPSYSFAAALSDGMFYDPAIPATVISHNNCASRLNVGNIISMTAANGDVLNVGASINLIGAVGSTITIHSGNTANLLLIGGQGASGDVDIQTGSGAPTSRLKIQQTGGWLVSGVAGVSGQALLSGGPGVGPTWGTPVAVATTPISSLLAAIATNTINNLTFQQRWQWGDIPAISFALLIDQNVIGTSNNGALLGINTLLNSRSMAMNVTRGTEGLLQIGYESVIHSPNGVTGHIAGATLTISAGDGLAASSGSGGQVSMKGGLSYTAAGPGTVTISGGDAGAIAGGVGNLFLQGGNSFTGSGAAGASVFIELGSLGGATGLEGTFEVRAQHSGTVVQRMGGRPDVISFIRTMPGRAADPVNANSGGLVISTGVLNGAGVPGGIRLALNVGAVASPTTRFIDLDTSNDLSNVDAAQCDVGVGGLANMNVATNRGFFYLPNMAGTPTGTPTARGGRVPCLIDSTGSKLWAFIGGAWKSTTFV